MSSHAANGITSNGTNGLSSSPPIPAGALTPKIEQDEGFLAKYPNVSAKLPIPKLEDTCRRYLASLEGLQEPEEHAKTKAVVEQFLTSGEGAKWQQRLIEYDQGVDSYIEEFWYESYLSHSDSVVLSLNPFFVLSSDVTPRNDPQLSRASSLILSSLLFIHDLRNGVLKPDSIRGSPLDMSQYERLFATSRVPTETGCRMETYDQSRHIVVIRRGQFYWFDVLDAKNRPMLSDREILSNLQGIVADADKIPVNQTSTNAVGILTTENRKIWSRLRGELRDSNRHNARCLSIVESSLFVVCLDDAEPADVGDLCANFLCGGYRLEHGVQVGTCLNRWYDKLQIIVCSNGEAGVNFEHTGVDGHTVLRYVGDVFTELVLLFAKTINPSTPSLFKAKLSPFAKGSKTPREADDVECEADTNPKKLDWRLTPDLRAGVRFAETRISDLICQNDTKALEFRGYGGNFIKRHGFSPDAFVQMAFQAAYYSLYGRVESTYEPAMTKAFRHGRTEAIRSVTTPSVKFVKTFCSDTATPAEKIDALRKACKRHTELTRECSAGQGQDRHLYAMHSLIQKVIHANEKAGLPAESVPALFTDPGYSTLSSSVLSTSNCGNPALRLFGFGPVTPEGYGIGYIIKDEGISVCMSSKHLQTRRLLKTLQAYLLEARSLIIQLWREANERPQAFVDHSGVMRDARTGRRLSDHEKDDEAPGTVDDEEDFFTGFGYFDVGSTKALEEQGKRRRPAVGKVIQIAEY
ncbi:hypothetical protein VHUM_00411 [Vanrija humicola]|uniref:Choline/carnitine acyltransferase domain-containing protein n=1 Tax=Vanrija humicola TaxID=5417 RepID=A0A7D8V693_VANHU|nr:hypothetical protein VHUM_00411 [Vanrija humicola]